jgi:hypothetical protein
MVTAVPATPADVCLAPSEAAVDGEGTLSSDSGRRRPQWQLWTATTMPGTIALALTTPSCIGLPPVGSALHGVIGLIATSDVDGGIQGGHGVFGSEGWEPHSLACKTKQHLSHN